MSISNALVAGGTETKIENPTGLSAEIFRFMKKHTILLEEELVVDVKFKINEYKEIVVLSVECDKAEVRNFIFKALSNKKLDINSYEAAKLYNVPVRLKP